VGRIEPDTAAREVYAGNPIGPATKLDFSGLPSSTPTVRSWRFTRNRISGSFEMPRGTVCQD